MTVALSPCGHAVLNCACLKNRRLVSAVYAPRRPMNKEERELLKKRLNQIISDALHGPTGDPDQAHLRIAATAFVLLERLRLPILFKKDMEEALDVDAGGGTYLYWARKEET